MRSTPVDRIVLDEKLIGKLRASMQSVDIYDAAGKVIGFFVPKVDPAEYESLEPEIDNAEIRRRLESKGPRYTTAEILRDLELS
jgi:hypothetical protein